MSDVCGMCDMLQNENKEQIIYETTEACAVIKYGKRSFHTPIEFLVVPKKHVVNLKDVNASNCLIDMLEVVNYLAGKDGEYKIVCNNGSSAGQTLFHLHWYISSTQFVLANINSFLTYSLP